MKFTSGILAAGSMLFLTAVAPAAVSVEVQSETLSESSSTFNGFFDVFLGITGTGNGELGGWQAQVNLATGAGQPTGLSLGTPIVTDGASPRTMALGDSNFSTPIAGDPANSASSVSATQFLLSSFPSLDGLNNDGLMRVPFTLAANSTGVYQLSLGLSASQGTVLSNNVGGNITFTPVNGTITVNSVPEPTGISLLALSATGLLARRRKAAI